MLYMLATQKRLNKRFANRVYKIVLGFNSEQWKFGWALYARTYLKCHDKKCRKKTGEIRPFKIVSDIILH